MAQEKKKTTFRELSSPERWEDEERVSILTPLEINGEKKGISVKIGKKTDGYQQYTHKLWIDENFNLISWINWLVKTIKKPYFMLFGKTLNLEDNIDSIKARKEELTKQLTNIQLKLELAEKRNQEDKKLLELINKTRNKYQIDFKGIFNEFSKIINTSIREGKGKEEDIKNMIKENSWLLGLECLVEAKNQNVDNQTEIDLHIKTRYNKDVIVEIKSPNLHPFRRKSEKGRYTLSQELAEAISEIIYYLRRTDIYSDRVGEGTYGIQKAEGLIIIGYNLNDEEMRTLKELNHHLYPHIRIITFDELKINIEREIYMLDKME